LLWKSYIKGLVLLLVAAFIFSCSIRSNYKTFSIFFDGVPNPHIVDSIAQADSIKKSEIATPKPARVVKSDFILHPPYAERDCEGCHNKNSMGSLRESMPALCYQCHESFNEKYEFVHGPVDAGYCTECHSAHMSKNDKLLIRTGQEICLYCHDSEDILQGEVHSDIEDTNCTDCHNPHGGEDRYIFN